MKYQLTPLQVHLVGIAGMTILGAVGYFLAIEPVLNQNAAQMRRESENASADRDAIVAEANVRADRRTAELLQGRLDRINIKLEPPARTNDRIVRMTNLAESHAVRVVTLEPGIPVAQQRHTLVPVRFTGSSDFASMVSFLAAIRTEFPDTRLDELELRSAGGTSEFLLTCTWFAAPSGSAGVDDR